jgi:tetracycline repressor-like protein
MRLLIGTILEAQAEGDLDPAEDAQQPAFELTSFLLLGNTQFVVTQEPAAIDRPRRSVDRRLAQAVTSA